MFPHCFDSCINSLVIWGGGHRLSQSWFRKCMHVEPFLPQTYFVLRGKCDTSVGCSWTGCKYWDVLFNGYFWRVCTCQWPCYVQICDPTFDLWLTDLFRPDVKLTERLLNVWFVLMWPCVMRVDGTLKSKNNEQPLTCQSSQPSPAVRVQSTEVNKGQCFRDLLGRKQPDLH